MSALVSSFYLALCQAGAERALRAEGERDHLRPAFSRPGLVTLKANGPLSPRDRFRSVLARFQAPSYGRAGELADDLVALQREAKKPVRLHVVDADAQVPWDAADALRADLLALLGQRALREERPVAGDLVVTVVLGEGTPWLTMHRHGATRAPFPGGRPRLVLPADAPSRAWLKIEEAIARFGLDPLPGERALEIGAAPGGAVRALLDRGLEVVGVDPNEMDPAIDAHPRFLHVKTPSLYLSPAQIAGPFHWALVDVNVPPGTALRGALPFLEAHAGTLRGVVFTLKLKSLALIDEVPGWIARLERATPHLRFTAQQLWSHGQELVAVGRPR